MSSTPAIQIVPEVHVKTAEPDEEAAVKIQQIRSDLEAESVYQEFREWCTDDQLHRFLVARQGKVKEAKELTISALKWRKTRLPPGGIVDMPNWESYMGRECESGKIFTPGTDQHGRPVIVMDNAVQNSSSVDDMQTFLAWSLDFACEIMPSTVDKYVVFLNLQNFSLFNCPPMKSCTETVFMLCNGYPERLGHLVVYKPPYILNTVYSAVKGLIDAKTLTKINFISGDVSPNSNNDKLLNTIIGEHWRELTKAEHPPVVKGRAAGYDHNMYWSTVIERVDVLKQRKDKSGKSIATTSNSESNNNNNNNNSSDLDDSVTPSIESLTISSEPSTTATATTSNIAKETVDA